MSYMKSLARSGADGNTRLLKEYGGKESKAKAYANGGSVVGDDDDDDDDDSDGVVASDMSADVDGAPSKSRLDRPGRKMKGKEKGGTNVNVIIMPKSDGPADGPAPAPGPVAAAPMPPPPPAAPPMAGGPPMPPMRKHGGGVGAYANGGSVGKLSAEGQTSATESEAMASRKSGGRACKAEGGPAYGKMDAGAGGAKGRLEKIKAYGK